MRAEIERHADLTVGELLWCVDRRIGRYDDRREGHHAATAKLTALNAGVLHATIVAPFTGVIHIGLALLEQAAVAAIGIESLWSHHIGAGVAVGTVVGVD